MKKIFLTTKTKAFLILIILLAFILRFWRLDSYPSLNADEAAIGYNAYSLIQTGLDEHGHAFPIHFQSFNDYKPGLYFYLVLPFVKVMGLNEWAVRIPGALFGVLSVLIAYFLVKELFGEKGLGFRNYDLGFAEIAAFMLAISPWHLQFSRGGWEVNTATFFILSGLLFFFKALKEKSFRSKIIKLVLSSLFLVASLYTYHSARVIVPLLGISLIFIYWIDIFKNLKPYLIFIAVTVVFITPLVINMFSSITLSRVAGVGLFADQGPINRINEQRGEHKNVTSITGRFLHNKVINYGLAFADNWASHFHGEFLFMSGDSIERNKVPETGEMYLIDILFLVIGFIYLSKGFSNNWKFIILWLVIAPIASALTFQSPNALRSQNMVIPLVIISAFGLTKIIKWLNSQMVNKILRTTCYILLTTMVIWCFTRYINMYYLHMSKVYPYSSQYGVKELVNYVSENESKYKDIYVTNRYDQPYILFLFYTKYPPQKFQERHTLTSRDDYGFSTVADFDKYHFGEIDFESLKNNYPKSLIIGTPSEIPDSANIIKRIYGTNGFEYFNVVQN